MDILELIKKLNMQEKMELFILLEKELQLHRHKVELEVG